MQPYLVDSVRAWMRHYGLNNRCFVGRPNPWLEYCPAGEGLRLRLQNRFEYRCVMHYRMIELTHEALFVFPHCWSTDLDADRRSPTRDSIRIGTGPCSSGWKTEACG